MYTSFMSHVEKVSRSLEKVTSEHRALSHFIDYQITEQHKLKKGICELGRGISYIVYIIL